MHSLLFEGISEKKTSQVSPAVLFINENPEKDPSVKDLAMLCRLSESHFRRLFISETGVSPLKYKNGIRISRACDYLTSHMLPVSRVAEIMGFDTLYSFSKFFKNEMGISPLKYVKTKRPRQKKAWS
jgi:transcriptional regulator GlxA family with amidase domain